ncbi:hypothetical protein ACTQ6A_06150 [Lachnospiraceae bacterium LCP25S3_G4]
MAIFFFCLEAKTNVLYVTGRILGYGVRYRVKHAVKEMITTSVIVIEVFADILKKKCLEKGGTTGILC